MIYTIFFCNKNAIFYFLGKIIKIIYLTGESLSYRWDRRVTGNSPVSKRRVTGESPVSKRWDRWVTGEWAVRSVSHRWVSGESAVESVTHRWDRWLTGESGELTGFHRILESRGGETGGENLQNSPISVRISPVVTDFTGEPVAVANLDWQYIMLLIFIF